jgi:hypothetical protein
MQLRGGEGVSTGVKSNIGQTSQTRLQSIENILVHVLVSLYSVAYDITLRYVTKCGSSVISVTLRYFL